MTADDTSAIEGTVGPSGDTTVTQLGYKFHLSDRIKMKAVSLLALLAMLVDFCHGWCVGIGHNPTFKGKPKVEQLSDLSSVKVSWGGLVDYLQCADKFLVSYWMKGSPHDYQLTKFLDPSVSSVVIPDIKLSVPYVYQVIAKEDKGLLGIDYNRSPHIPFTITRNNIHKKKSSVVKPPPVDTDDDVTEESDDDTNSDVIDRSDDGIEEPTIDEIKETIKEEKLLWEKEAREKSVYIIIGSVVGCLILIVLSAGAIYQFVKVRRSKRTLAGTYDDEGNATYDRFEDKCHCDN